MKLLTFYHDNKLKLGIKTDPGVIDVAEALGVDLTPDKFYHDNNPHQTMKQLRRLTTIPPAIHLPDNGTSTSSSSSFLLQESTLTLGPCVPNPGKIICIGLNYAKHAAESGKPLPSQPIVFSKFNNALAGHAQNVPYSSECTQVDYEAELVVVIGKTAKNVSKEEALDYVRGYCNGNDLSERRLQFGASSGQWLIGKTLDQFFPIGPYMVTAEEAQDPKCMQIRGWLNGELRQNSNTADMIFNVPHLIAYLSRFMTLYPGDLISTGTPEGVILGKKEKVWMKPGDTFEVEIGNLGRLTNTLVREDQNQERERLRFSKL